MSDSGRVTEVQIFKKASIKQTLIWISLLTAGFALILSAMFLIFEEVIAAKNALLKELDVQAEIIGNNSTAALSFNDSRAAGEILSALRANENIEIAALYTKYGALFADYNLDGKRRAAPRLLQREGHRFGLNYLAVYRNVVLDKEIIGSIYIKSNLKKVYYKIFHLIGAFIAAIIFSLFAAYFFSSRMQKTITGRISDLSQLMKDLTKRKDYAVRASGYGADEIGQLADSFNVMTEDLLKTTVSRDYVDSIIKNMIDSLIVIGPDGGVETINKSTCDLLGYHEDELIGKPIGTIFTEDISTKDMEKAENIETTYLTKYDKKIPVLFSCSVMLDDRGQTRGYVCVASDITERKVYEREKESMQLKMFTTSKLASLGEIATGVAHEINQPLTYINSFIQGLQISLESNTIDKTKLQERLKISSKQIQRIIEIVQHLRTFGRQDDIAMHPVNIEEVFNNTLLLMGERIRLKNINLLRQIEPGLPSLNGNSTRLEQLFINLLQNSIDALPGETADAMIKVEISVSEKEDSIVIKISDNGKGIEKKNLEKIFEPFFTTKEVGKGTGIGLSIVYGIVQEHNGVITCESEVKKGSAFTITLPVKR